MVVNDYFGPRRTNIPHSNTNYGPIQSKFEVYYYRQKYLPLEKTLSYMRKIGKVSQRSNLLLIYFNSKYMEFFVYETCDKLIWTSGEGSRITNEIIKQLNPKTNINKVSTARTLGFGCSPIWTLMIYC